jgi:hypothetical protein
MTGRLKHAQRARRSHNRAENGLKEFNAHRVWTENLRAHKTMFGGPNIVSKLLDLFRTKNQRETKADVIS